MKLIKVETVIIHVSSNLEVTPEFEMNFDLSQKAIETPFKNSFIPTALEKNFSLLMSSSERN